MSTASLFVVLKDSDSCKINSLVSQLTDTPKPTDSNSSNSINQVPGAPSLHTCCFLLNQSVRRLTDERLRRDSPPCSGSAVCFPQVVFEQEASYDNVNLS